MSTADEYPSFVAILPIPLRKNVVVRVQGLPYDLTPAEASKIANVILAMAGKKDDDQ